MEESISLLSQIKETFACKETDIRTYSPITLAFLGDCIYDLVIRTVLVERCNRDANSLHKIKSAVVKADAQAEMIEALSAGADGGRSRCIQKRQECQNLAYCKKCIGGCLPESDRV